MTKRTATLTLIGGPTVLIELAGFRLLTDPTFDGPGQYEARGVKLEKKHGPAVGPDAIGSIDAVLLSHDQHFDNLDRLGRTVLNQAGKTFTTRVGADRLGGSAIGLDPWQGTPLDRPAGSRIHIGAAPARHGPPGIEPITGDVVGFLLGIDQPGDAVYVTGDTVWYEGVAEVARRYDPRLVVVFAGSAKPRGPFHVTMDANDAIETAHAFPDATIVAVHTDGWGHFTESQADLARAFETLGLGDRLRWLEPGRPTEIAL